MTIDLHTLSGAYVLDALSPEEAEEFRLHLEQCQACRDEVRELREAAATMGASEALAPPADLRARVLAAADRQPQLPPRVTTLERTRSFPTRFAVVAAAIVVVLAGAVGIVLSQRSEEQPPVAAAVSQVFDAADAKTATVDTANGGRVTVATSQQLGRMALETDTLPELRDRHVYQLWAVHNGTPTSAGVVRDLDAGAAMAMPAAGTTVAITIEPAGGSAEPTTKPIVQMDPAQV
jgi:anti-sigma-K factor RskA